MSRNQHKIPKLSTMAGREVPQLDNYSQSFGQCAPLQEKTINIASQQLINILSGKTNTPKKPITSKRPHPTCSHRTPSPHACQITISPTSHPAPTLYSTFQQTLHQKDIPPSIPHYKWSPNIDANQSQLK